MKKNKEYKYRIIELTQGDYSVSYKVEMKRLWWWVPIYSSSSYNDALYFLQRNAKPSTRVVISAPTDFYTVPIVLSEKEIHLLQNAANVRKTTLSKMAEIIVKEFCMTNASCRDDFLKQ